MNKAAIAKIKGGASQQLVSWPLSLQLPLKKDICRDQDSKADFL